MKTINKLALNVTRDLLKHTEANFGLLNYLKDKNVFERVQYDEDGDIVDPAVFWYYNEFNPKVNVNDTLVKKTYFKLFGSKVYQIPNNDDVETIIGNTEDINPLLDTFNPQVAGLLRTLLYGTNALQAIAYNGLLSFYGSNVFGDNYPIYDAFYNDINPHLLAKVALWYLATEKVVKDRNPTHHHVVNKTTRYFCVDYLNRYYAKY